jgi:hypothetical protein
MRHKGWLVLAACLVVVGLIYLAMQPVFVFQALANAGQAGDRGRLAAMVDFPAVREDLKTQLAARVEAAVTKDKSPFGGLASLLGPAVVDQVVDAAVTPEGVAAIVRSGRAPLSELSARKTALPPPSDTAAPPPAAASLAPTKARTRFAYTGINSFKATSIAKDGAELGWVLERRGFSWQLARIELPPG